jgi:cell division septal protein FtsQ
MCNKGELINMSTKKQRRQAAQQKAKKKRMTILAACAACVVVAVVVVIIINATRPDTRVFSVPGNQSVTLYENGNFIARLAHNVNISGTYTEDVEGNITTISFTHDGGTVSSQIENDVLLLPIPWRAACRIHSHEIEFPIQR